MLATLGIEVPVYAHRVEMGFFQEPANSTMHCYRILSDARTVLYLRPEGHNQIFVGWRDSAKEFKAADPDNYWQTAQYERLADMHRRLIRTLPFMAEGFIHRSYACVYDHTPDAMPILDRAESLEGLYFSLGYSGGGFSLSPWVGAVMARYMVEGVKSPEMKMLRASRFGEGELLDWNNVKDMEVR
jgi:glycine/D-amino acid oxidase-like deaminating enzyme